MFLSRYFDRQLYSLFYKYGNFVARNSISVIVFSVLLNGLLGINIIWLKLTSDIYVYTPSNSQAEQDYIRVNQHFPDFGGTNFYEHNLVDLGRYGSLIIKTKNGSNLLNETYKFSVQELMAFVGNISIKVGDTNYTYRELCTRRNRECTIKQSVLYSNKFWNQVNDANLSFPYFVDEKGHSNDLSRTIGGVVVQDGAVTFAKAFKIVFNLRNDTNMYADLAKTWEVEFIKIFKSYMNINLSVAFSNSESLGRELDSNTRGDVTYFSLTFTLMIFYASFAAAGGNCVSNRGHLGRAGVIASGLAILGAFGLGSVMKVEFVNIVGVVPFLIIGIGLDDMFILLSSHAESSGGGSPEERIGRTVQSSGVAMTITSLTNIVAFTVGSFSPFKSVRNFSIYTGIAIFLCFINQMTFFLGCMSIHEKRVAANRHCLTCIPTKTTAEMKKDGTSACRAVICGGSGPSSRSEQESFLERLPSVLIPKVVLWLPMKVMVILGIAGYLGVSIWGIANLKQGLLLRNLVSESSYFHSYSTWEYDLFPSQFAISVYFPLNLDFTSKATDNEFTKLMSLVCGDRDIDCTNEINWYSAYKSSIFYSNTSLQSFCLSFRNFLEHNSLYKNDVILKGNCTILQSRVHVFSSNLKDSYSQGKLMLRLREIADKTFQGTFIYSPAFIFFEQYVAVLPNTLLTVGASIVGVFLVTCVFMSNPLVIMYVTISLAVLLSGLLGFLYIWELSLSAITMLHIIMSVGFSVDYSAHICHAYLVSEGETRNIRVNEAIVKSGGPIFNGALSSLIGIFTLAHSESYVFTSFFKIILLVICFGLGQALLFLPVLLSLVGPHRKPDIEKTVIFSPNDSGLDNNGFQNDINTHF